MLEIFQKNFLFFSKKPLHFAFLCGKIYDCMDFATAHPLRRSRLKGTTDGYGLACDGEISVPSGLSSLQGDTLLRPSHQKIHAISHITGRRISREQILCSAGQIGRMALTFFLRAVLAKRSETKRFHEYFNTATTKICPAKSGLDPSVVPKICKGE